MQLSATNKSALDYGVPIGAAALIFYNIYKKKGDVKEAATVAVIVAIIGYVVVSQITKSILVATTNSLSAVKKNEIAQEYGANTKEVEAAQQRARMVHSAFYGVDGEATTEDEDAAISAINQCGTPAEVQMTCKIYQSTYGKSLAGDFSRFVHWWDGDISSIVKSNWY